MAKTKFSGEVTKVYPEGKTVSLLTKRVKRQQMYGKVMKLTKKLIAHCEIAVKAGDQIEVVETSPVSKKKIWRVVKIIQAK